ncbi:MAG: hybrid sensor histidine kinase/response regulator [Deltaproteobacteria bacterium]|jgi:signal transduction histidine kinase|nr:MAG: hybrid sensor histidine kinase/response regulator [Deltaproteobacteria bacterium]
MQDEASVLIVDDELGPRESLRMILKPIFNVHTAENGEKALEFIKQKPVNLVTLDLKMPGIPGIEVLKEIKGYNPDIEVIIITGYGRLNTAVEALKYGALDYIDKPFNIPQVEEAVKKGVKRYKVNTLSRMLTQTLNIPNEEIQGVIKMGHTQLEDQLIYAEKLTVLGKLTPKIAHEINNHLQIIYGMAQQGLIKTKGEEVFNKYFDSIFTEAEKIDHIAQQLMKYGKPPEHKKDNINVQKILDYSLNLLEDFGETKRFHVRRCYRDALPLIRGDKFQLEQVFINIIINASHAVEKTTNKELIVETDLSSDGQSIEVTISDTGCGIKEENLEKIFSPFFTTKEEEKGKGLGLSIVKAFVEKHQGHIEVKSKLGKGTSFKIILPITSNNKACLEQA